MQDKKYEQFWELEVTKYALHFSSWTQSLVKIGILSYALPRWCMGISYEGLKKYNCLEF